MFGFFSKSADSATITGPEVEAMLSGADKPFVLDVREPGEYREGHIPGSTLMPLGTLGARLHELPRDRRIVAVCRSGARSGSATGILRKAGFDAVNMTGGMLGWRGPVER